MENEQKLHANAQLAAKQIETAIIRIGETLLNNATQDTAIATAWAVSGFIARVAKDPDGAIQIARWMAGMIEESAMAQMNVKLASTTAEGSA